MIATDIHYVVDFGGLVSGGADDLGSRANSKDLEKFQESMAAQAESIVEGVGGASFSGSAPSNSLGDRILEGIQSVKSGYDDQVGAVQDRLKTSDPLNVNEMMGIQLELAKLTLQGELINKTVSKSTQNIDTLLKSQ